MSDKQVYCQKPVHIILQTSWYASDYAILDLGMITEEVALIEEKLNNVNQKNLACTKKADNIEPLQVQGPRRRGDQ